MSPSLLVRFRRFDALQERCDRRVVRILGAQSFGGLNGVAPILLFESEQGGVIPLATFLPVGRRLRNDLVKVDGLSNVDGAHPSQATSGHVGGEPLERFAGDEAIGAEIFRGALHAAGDVSPRRPMGPYLNLSVEPVLPTRADAGVEPNAQLHRNAKFPAANAPRWRRGSPSFAWPRGKRGRHDRLGARGAPHIAISSSPM